MVQRPAVSVATLLPDITQTEGVVANGQATAVNVAMQLGLTLSATNPAQVSIDMDNGLVTINGVSTGQSVALQVVGGG